MAKKVSTAYKFKMITDKDLFQAQQELDKALKSGGEITEIMEFVQFGLYLALFQDNIPVAKSDFAEYKETHAFDANGKGLKELVELWKKEI